MNQYARAAIAKKTGVDPVKKEPAKEWGLWNDTAQQWEGGAGNPVKGSYQKCAGIKKIKEQESKFIKYIIKPYKQS